MSSFPSDRAAKRQALLDAVDGVRQAVLDHADECEQQATLCGPTVEALRTSGLLTLKLPAVLGGAEADPMTQTDVIEALSAIDPSAGWCLMVGATTLALPSVFLPDEGVAALFAGGQIPLAAGSYMPTGHAVPDGTAYRVSGRWAFASGIRHAAWVSATAQVVRNGAPTGERRSFVCRTSDVQIHDNWDVAGLRGTGSCDFSVTDLLVPETFTWDAERAKPRRGGALYRLGWPAFVANEHCGFALGVARRALEVVTEVAGTKTRGTSPTLLASRPTFHRFVGTSELRLKAARALAREVNEAAWSVVSAGGTLTQRQQAELRSTAAFVSDEALEVVTGAFRYAGGSALYRASVLQRGLRDLHAGAQHFMVSDSAYEALGQFILGRSAASPMA